jgi:hypothetical protein
MKMASPLAVFPAAFHPSVEAAWNLRVRADKSIIMPSHEYECVKLRQIMEL